MIVAGCDVGSLTGKTVILKDSEILSFSIVPTTPKPERTALNAMNGALEKVKLSLKDIDYIVGTGYGRVKIPFANSEISELTCHGKGAHSYFPSIRTIIDVGGQDCKVIKVNKNGKILDFAMNDKCAAGTGRFLEVMAKTLELNLEDLGPISLESKKQAKITAQCSVFAETEVVSLMADGVEVSDIVAGIHDAIASRIMSLVYRVGLEEELTITGGVAKNIGVVAYLERRMGIKAKNLPIDPQLIGALGAALIAKEQLNSQ
ncbi:MAG: acyl-CoA dehydratase activase [Candidatus Hermodarchaeota archaeon]